MADFVLGRVTPSSTIFLLTITSLWWMKAVYTVSEPSRLTFWWKGKK